MKTRNNLLLLAIVLLSIPILLGGCNLSSETLRGDGNIVKETFQIDQFHSIDLTGMFNVTLEVGEKPLVTLETDANLMDLMDVETQSGVLFVKTNRKTMLMPTKMDLHIIYTDLQKLSAGGACKIFSPHPLRAPSMLFDISGAVDLDMEMQVQELHTLVSGASSIRLAGIANQHKLELSGASNLKAQDLITEITDIKLSGAGSALVHATQELRADLSGIGTIRYYGDPAKTTFNKSGLGTIKSVR